MPRDAALIAEHVPVTKVACDGLRGGRLNVIDDVIGELRESAEDALTSVLFWWTWWK